MIFEITILHFACQHDLISHITGSGLKVLNRYCIVHRDLKPEVLSVSPVCIQRLCACSCNNPQPILLLFLIFFFMFWLRIFFCITMRVTRSWKLLILDFLGKNSSSKVKTISNQETDLLSWTYIPVGFYIPMNLPRQFVDHHCTWLQKYYSSVNMTERSVYCLAV